MTPQSFANNIASALFKQPESIVQGNREQGIALTYVAAMLLT